MRKTYTTFFFIDKGHRPQMLTIFCTNQLKAQQVNFNGGDEGVDFLDELYVQHEGQHYVRFSVLSTLWDSNSMAEMKSCEHKEKITAFYVTSLGHLQWKG